MHIVAFDEARGIGKDNSLPWKSAKDMAWFKDLTSNCVVIMGRKTHESIGRPLPHRVNIVLSSGKIHKSVINVSDLETAITTGKGIARGNKMNGVFIIGGGELYKASLDLVDSVVATEFSGTFDCDTHYPELDDFDEVVCSAPTEDGDLRFTIRLYERKA